VFDEVKATKGKKVKVADIKARAAEKGGKPVQRSTKHLILFLEGRTAMTDSDKGRGFAKSLLSYLKGKMSEEKLGKVWEATF
jgi:hypothetical protein